MHSSLDTTSKYASSSCGNAFACLYSKHKLQKRKVWKDGKIVLSNNHAILYDGNPPPGASNLPLDEVDLTKHELDVLRNLQGTDMETEKFMVTIEGPWKKGPIGPVSREVSEKRVISSGMKKLLTQKYRKPAPYVPRQPQMKRQRGVIGRNRDFSLEEDGNHEYHEIRQNQPKHIHENYLPPPHRNQQLSQHHCEPDITCEDSSNSQVLNSTSSKEDIGRNTSHSLHFQSHTRPIKNSRSTMKSNNTFISNEFDPSSFYGVDIIDTDCDLDNEECEGELFDSFSDTKSVNYKVPRGREARVNKKIMHSQSVEHQHDETCDVPEKQESKRMKQDNSCSTNQNIRNVECFNSVESQHRSCDTDYRSSAALREANSESKDAQNNVLSNTDLLQLFGGSICNSKSSELSNTAVSKIVCNKDGSPQEEHDLNTSKYGCLSPQNTIEYKNDEDTDSCDSNPFLENLIQTEKKAEKDDICDKKEILTWNDGETLWGTDIKDMGNDDCQNDENSNVSNNEQYPNEKSQTEDNPATKKDDDNDEQLKNTCDNTANTLGKMDTETDNSTKPLTFYLNLPSASDSSDNSESD